MSMPIAEAQRKEISRLGGEGRAKRLSAARRKKIARAGGLARARAQEEALGSVAWLGELSERSHNGGAANARRVAQLKAEDPEALRAEMARRGKLGGRPPLSSKRKKQAGRKAKKAKRLEDGHK